MCLGWHRRSTPAGRRFGRRRAWARVRLRERRNRSRSCLWLFAQALIASLGTELEHPLRHPPDLDLLGSLGNPVPAVMTVDVLERLVPAVADAAVDLHGPVGGLA